MRDTSTSHFEPSKFDWVGRRGQKQPKWGYFWRYQNTPIKFILRGLPGRCGLFCKPRLSLLKISLRVHLRAFALGTPIYQSTSSDRSRELNFLQNCTLLVFAGGCDDFTLRVLVVYISTAFVSWVSIISAWAQPSGFAQCHKEWI